MERKAIGLFFSTYSLLIEHSKFGYITIYGEKSFRVYFNNVEKEHICYIISNILNLIYSPGQKNRNFCEIFEYVHSPSFVDLKIALVVVGHFCVYIFNIHDLTEYQR